MPRRSNCIYLAICLTGPGALSRGVSQKAVASTGADSDLGRGSALLKGSTQVVPEFIVSSSGPAGDLDLASRLGSPRCSLAAMPSSCPEVEEA